jgi:hypothetical protein
LIRSAPIHPTARKRQEYNRRAELNSHSPSDARIRQARTSSIGYAAKDQSDSTSEL